MLWLGEDYPFLNTIIGGFLYMWSPAIAVFIVEGFKMNEISHKYGFNFSSKKIRWGKMFLYYLLAVLLIPVFICLLTYIFGNQLQINGVGLFAESSDMIWEYFEDTFGRELPEDANIPDVPPPVLILLGVGAAYIAGLTINGLFAFGEELGWRGLLYDEWKHLGFVQMNILTGIVWGLWHAPLIIGIGHNYPDAPYLGTLMMVFLCIGMSFLLADSRRKTNAVLAPTIIHGAINGMGGLLLLVIVLSDRLIGGLTGIVGAVSCFLVFLVMRSLFSNAEDGLNHEEIKKEEAL